MATMSTRLNANHWLGQYGTRKARQCSAVRVFGTVCVWGGAYVIGWRSDWGTLMVCSFQDPRCYSDHNGYNKIGSLTCSART